jgi:hypothetical protein
MSGIEANQLKNLIISAPALFAVFLLPFTAISHMFLRSAPVRGS